METKYTVNEILAMISVLTEKVVNNNPDQGVVYLAQCKIWGLMELIDAPKVPESKKEVIEDNVFEKI